jgi:outer membrane protein, heavy metal efflux system
MKFSIDHRWTCRQRIPNKGNSASLGKSFFLVRLFILFLSPFTFGYANAQVLRLDSVLAMVERENVMLKEYDEKVNALNAYAKGATSWMAPMVGVGTFMKPYPNQMLMDERDKGSWMFSLEQDIPNPLKLKANKRYLESRGKVEDRGKQIQLNALRAEAKTYYYQWLAAERKVEVLKENARIIELMLKLAQIRYPYNQGTLGNIYRTEARLNEVKNMQLMTQSTIEALRLKVGALMNKRSSDSLQIDTATVVSFNRHRIAEDTASLSGQRSDIQQIEDNIQVMRLNQQLQRAQAKPDLRIRFDHMQPIGNMPTQFTAMAMISIPIAPWSSKMYRAEVKGMEYDIRAMEKERDAILIEARGMLTAMAAQLTRMEQQLSNYEKRIIPALRKNHQSVMLAYEENREQLPAVIDAMEALTMSQMEYLENLEQYYLMIVSYEKEIEK